MVVVDNQQKPRQRKSEKGGRGITAVFCFVAALAGSGGGGCGFDEFGSPQFYFICSIDRARLVEEKQKRRRRCSVEEEEEEEEH